MTILIRNIWKNRRPGPGHFGPGERRQSVRRPVAGVAVMAALMTMMVSLAPARADTLRPLPGRVVNAGPSIARSAATTARRSLLAYVTNLHSNTVSVINVATNTVVATIPVGSGPVGVALSPRGTRAYVSNQGSDTVSVINTRTNAVITNIPAGNGPSGVADSPGELASMSRTFSRTTCR